MNEFPKVRIVVRHPPSQRIAPVSAFSERIGHQAGDWHRQAGLSGRGGKGSGDEGVSDALQSTSRWNHVRLQHTT